MTTIWRPSRKASSARRRRPRPPRPPRPSQIKVRLSDNRIREIQTTISTYFFVSGKTLGVEEFLNYLFDEVNLPKIFKSE